MLCAFKPVEDVCASSVIDLVEWVSIGFLDSHRIAERQMFKDTSCRKKDCTILSCTLAYYFYPFKLW